MRHAFALNTDLSATLGDAVQAPEWVELIPAGPSVIGRDGRSWLFDADAQAAVQSAFTARGLDIPVDWNHATELQAPNGGDAPASGWIAQLDIRDGALWGRVEWTSRGANSITSREYRYLSPVFDFDPATKRIARLVSAALLNKPNLRLTALNSEETPVALSAALAAALGITPEATDEAAVAAVNQLKATATAANSETRNLDKFVPRADHDAALTRATNAESALAARDKADHEKAVGIEIDAALKAGKITPATVDYHRASCSDAAGLERFKAFVQAAATVGDPSQLDTREPNTTTKALNAEEQQVARQLGISAEDFIKAKSA